MLAGLLAMTSGVANAATVLVGDQDNFASYDASIDNTNSPVASTDTFFGMSFPTGELDGTGADTTISQHFDLSGWQTIDSAVLTIMVRAADGFSQNDVLGIGFLDGSSSEISSQMDYVRGLGVQGSSSAYFLAAGEEGLLTGSGYYTSGTTGTITLDLGALVLGSGGTLDLLSAIIAIGFFDVVISDDTNIDFFSLDITGTPRLLTAQIDGQVLVNPLPGGLVMMLTGLVGGGFAARRRKKNSAAI